MRIASSRDPPRCPSWSKIASLSKLKDRLPCLPQRHSRWRFVVGSPNNSMSSGSASRARAVLTEARSSAARVIQMPFGPGAQRRAGANDPRPVPPLPL